MRRFLISTSCSVALLLACASALSAQDTTFVSQGARVKVFPSMEGTEPVIGEVVKLAYDTLVIVPEGNRSAQTFYPSDLRKIEVSQGKGETYTVIGFVSGIAVGVGVAIATCSGDKCDYFGGSDLTALAIVAHAGIGGLVGAGVGALIDLVIIGERWKEADMPPPPPVALGLGKDGSVRLSFSLRL